MLFDKDPDSAVIAEIRGLPRGDLAGQRLELARFQASPAKCAAILDPSGLFVLNFQGLIRAGPSAHGASVTFFKINTDSHINLQV
jgi:hypothetical protein